MCGIAGFLGFSGDEAKGQSILRVMGSALAHRGPDDCGYLVSPLGDARLVGLAHRRLSIIDLAGGHQPLGNEDGSVQIVFNGEIYNFQELRRELEAGGHTFRTRSDTEVVVRAYEQWGADCVSRLFGMFAFAIWDKTRQRLFLARDRFGKKPLFLHERDGVLYFASEIKSILSASGAVASFDTASLLPYLYYRYVPGPGTMFNGIRKLQPGTIACWERGELTTRQYYVSPDAVSRPAQARTPGDPVAAFLELFENAVAMRMVSDVPFGAFLSGGLDSSAVVAMMAGHSTMPIKTFSVGFAESGFSELDYARTVATSFKTDHHELTITDKDVIDNLSGLVRFRDAPVSEPSDIPIYLLSRSARQHVKMILTGEGSDEVLGGYPKHVFERFAALYGALPDWLHDGVVRKVVDRLPFNYQRLKTATSSLGTRDPRYRMPRWFGALDWHQAVQLLTPGPWKDLIPIDETIPRMNGHGDHNSALRRVLYFDQSSWLPDNLLERGDRMTMAASIEARMPFMDHRLLDFVSSLPDSWRVRGTTTKRILREAMSRILPPEILQRPKVGFRVPVREWFRGPMKDYVLDCICSANSRTRRYFESDRLDRLVSEHLQGRQNHEKLIWALVNLEILHREYRL